MSSTTLRFYNSTLAHQSIQRERRIRDLQKRIRVRLSRRRFKQSMRSIMTRMQP